jgi:hypothetical protein
MVAIYPNGFIVDSVIQPVVRVIKDPKRTAIEITAGALK